MFNPIFTDPDNELLKDRLARVQERLRQLDFPTREEYQAEVFSQVNAVLARGTNMSPLSPVAGEGPAVVGDVATNTDILNQDAGDIAKELLRIEDAAARLFNLSATSQNALRQQIREQTLGSNSRRFLEAFLHARNLSQRTAGLDFNAGVATLPLLDEVELETTLEIGSNSIGEVEVGVEALTDNRIETALIWNGTQLELIVTLDTTEIVNRMKIELDDYQGLEITALTTSSDGTQLEDVLVDLDVRSILLNGVVGKFSGDFIIDFPPRHTKQIRLVIEDRVDIARIALRSLTFFTRRYSASAILATNPISNPNGTVKFTSVEKTNAPLTSITHQISYNGVHYTAITPGDVISLTSTPFWYKAVLERSSSQFDEEQNPLIEDGMDPSASPNYTLRNTETIPLGNGILERTLIIDNITGPVKFRETPLPGTFQIQEGAVILDPEDYAFVNHTLSFSDDKTAVSVSYQTTAFGSAALADREEFYTPLLYEVRFERV
jgi:hypothetical protein